MKPSKYLDKFKKKETTLRPGLMYVELQDLDEVDAMSVGGKTLYRPTDLKSHKLSYKDKILNHVIILEVGDEESPYKPGDIVQIPLPKLQTYSKFGSLQPYAEETIALAQEEDIIERIGSSIDEYNRMFEGMNDG